MNDQINQQWGNYRLTHLLGSGGFADVYLGEHVRLKMQAAIKILHTNLSEQENEAFRQEAYTISRLIHPHIIRLLDFDLKEHHPFLVLDYAPGGTLRIPPGQALPLQQVVDYIKQVASALQHAHDQHLIHRDVKPANMLLGRHNEILLSDFGIAEMAHSTSSMRQQQAIGTLYYMAPEQIHGYPRPESDQYALAITAYQWLSGTLPFQGTMTEIISGHLMRQPQPLLQLAPALPPAVEHVVMKALAKDPYQRFPHVSALAEALEQASQNKAISLSSQSDPQPGSITADVTTMSAAPGERILPIPSGIPYEAPTEATPSGIAHDAPTSGTPSMAGSASYQRHAEQPTFDHPLPIPAHYSQPTLRTLQRPSRRTFLLGGGAVLGLASLGGIGALIWTHAEAASALTGPIVYINSGQHTNTTDDIDLRLYWSPDGTRLASVLTDNKHDTIQVWDTLDGKHATTYSLTAASSSSYKWANGSFLAAYDAESGLIKVVDTVSGNDIVTYAGHSDKSEKVSAIAWSPDGYAIASLAVIDVSVDSANKVSPVQIWDPYTNQLLVSCHMTLARGQHLPEAMLWSANNQLLVAWSPYNNIFYVWNTQQGTLISAYTAIWETYKEQITTKTAFYDVFSMALSPDGKYAAFIGKLNDNSGTLRLYLWRTDNGRQIYERLVPATTRNVTWSYDGLLLALHAYDASTKSQMLAVHQASDGALLYQSPAASNNLTIVGGFSWTPGQEHIATIVDDAKQEYRLSILDARTGKSQKTYTQKVTGEIVSHNQEPLNISIAPQGNLAAVVGDQGDISIWHLNQATS